MKNTVSSIIGSTIAVTALCGSMFAAESQPDSSISARFGIHGWKDSEDVDASYGSQIEAKFALGDSPFDFVVRGHFSYTAYDDYEDVETEAEPYSGGTILMAEVLEISDAEDYTMGGSAQLQWNFARNSFLNPYVALGGMYERTEFEADVGYAVASRGYYGRYATPIYVAAAGDHVKESDDGFAFVARAGLELNASPMYVRLEGGYLSELYGDDAQAELNAIVGVNVTDNLRMEIAGTYFTEWEEYYATAGLSLLL